jgi:hypothetical protein
MPRQSHPRRGMTVSSTSINDMGHTRDSSSFYHSLLSCSHRLVLTAQHQETKSEAFP